MPIPIGDDFKVTINHFEYVNTHPQKVALFFVGSFLSPIISSNIVSIVRLIRKSILFPDNLEIVIFVKDPHPIIKNILETNIEHVEYVDDYKKDFDQDWIIYM